MSFDSKGNLLLYNAMSCSSSSVKTASKCIESFLRAFFCVLKRDAGLSWSVYTETSKYPCNTLQAASRMRRAWIAQATARATSRYDRLPKECNAGLFVMDCSTRDSSRALRSVFIASILLCLAYSFPPYNMIHGLDVERFVMNYDLHWRGR